jgi:phenylalanyl-tRNA synthetase beta chain
MQFSESWLRSFVNPQLESEDLGHLLTMAGLEVEQCDPVAPPFSGVVVASIVETVQHPDADKLRICKVDDGSGERLQIVCGAPNAAVGMNVPLARVGARLPGFEIKAAKLRGVESFGMLCSARELGLSDDHAGLLELPADAKPGADVRDLLALDDMIFTIKLTPNRSDCLNLAGIAREVSALTGAPLTMPAIESVPPSIADRREIVLDAPGACPRYCGRILRGVDARTPSPEWMKQRLQHCGVRPISALVDVTNYVMLELGQPLHVFDDEKLSGAIHVRFPRPGESVLLLNEQTVEPAADTLLIADEARALALAGIMGGEDTGVTLETTDVFLESAFFAPEAIAGRARALGFNSDASHRFERGVDFALAGRAIERATRLIIDICGGRAGPVVEAVSPAQLPVRAAVRLRPDRVRKVLGIELDDATMVRLLESVHLPVEAVDGAFVVVPPSFRFDIGIEEDLIEEIVRLHGYDAVPALSPKGRLEMLEHGESLRSVWTLRRILADRDYQEVINYAFVDEAWESDFCANAAPIRLANPIASQMSVMRSSLIPGLVANLAANRNRQQLRIRLFETGRCFEHKAGGAPVAGFHQPLRLAALAAGLAQPEQWGLPSRPVDFYDVKGDLEALFTRSGLSFETFSHPALHPGRGASVCVDGRSVGIIGELHPVWVDRYELGSAPVVFELELDALLCEEVPAYREISRFPGVARDVALIVDTQWSAARVLQVLKASAPSIVTSIELFDVYHGKGIDPEKRSLAFRVLMQDTQRTLEDAEVEAALAEIVGNAMTSLGARLRG